YKAIRSVPAGTWMRFTQGGGMTQRRFFDITAEFAAAEQAPHDKSAAAIPPEELIREALNRSVRRHIIADVPVGVYLSSGLDSAAITAFASAATSEPLRTLTIGCAEYR